jgi:hypothetical protein
MNEQYFFYTPPKDNVKFRFGEETNTFFNVYIKKPPNAFQRWMLKTLLGIYMDLI